MWGMACATPLGTGGGDVGAMEGSCIGYDVCYAVARDSDVVGDVTNSHGERHSDPFVS